MEGRPQNGDPPGGLPSSRVFELYVDSLNADRDAADELLLVHLTIFSEDITHTVERLKKSPRIALALVKNLSSIMQDLDARAGGIEALSAELDSTRRWALLLPSSPEGDR